MVGVRRAAPNAISGSEAQQASVASLQQSRQRCPMHFWVVFLYDVKKKKYQKNLCTFNYGIQAY